MTVLNPPLSSIRIPKFNAVVAGAEEDSMLKSLAVLKLRVLGLHLGAGNAADVDVDEKDRSLRENPGILDQWARSWRSTGTFRKGPPTTNVLLEWKLVDGSRPPPVHNRSTYRIMAERRIKNLASVLKSSSKLVDMRTLHCLGVVSRDRASDDEVQLGMVFCVPSTQYVTLKTLLEQSHNAMVLDDRFKIARNITRAVLCLHLAGWMHKEIRSENILYFIDDNGKFPYAEPVVAGFEYSRQIAAPGQTESVTDDLEANLYRHPEVQGVPEEPETPIKQPAPQAHAPGRIPFGMKHDIFSVGMVLLELGTQRSAIQIYDEAVQSNEYGEHSAAAFRDWVISKGIPKLGGLRGADYLAAAAWCFKSETDGADTEEMQRSFYKHVVRAMGSFRNRE